MYRRVYRDLQKEKGLQKWNCGQQCQKDRELYEKTIIELKRQS